MIKSASDKIQFLAFLGLIGSKILCAITTMPLTGQKQSVAYLARGEAHVMPPSTHEKKIYGSIFMVFLVTIIALSRPTSTPEPDSNSIHGNACFLPSPVNPSPHC